MIEFERNTGRTFVSLTKEEGQAFWLSPTRYTTEVAAAVLVPLGKAVEIDDVLEHTFWGRYFKTIFVVVYSSTWKCRL